jgi:hypothetical protein
LKLLSWRGLTAASFHVRVFLAVAAREVKVRAGVGSRLENEG